MNNVELAISYAMKLEGKPYEWWGGGANETKDPMWCENGPPPEPEQVKSVNCVGLTNLMLRYLGKEIPEGLVDRGGTNDYACQYINKGVRFDMDKTYPRGSLLVRNFRNNEDQGHVAVILEEKGPEAKMLHSHTFFWDGKYHFGATEKEGEGYPGVNCKFTVESLMGFGHPPDFVVLPKDWLGTS